MPPTRPQLFGPRPGVPGPPSPRRAFSCRAKITVKSARCARVLRMALRATPDCDLPRQDPAPIGRTDRTRLGWPKQRAGSEPRRRALNAVRWEVASLAQRVGAAAKGAIMVIELAVPDDWTPGQALAMRQLLQQVMRTAQPIITAVRKDVTADQLKDVHDRIESLIREA